jgi:hypothetical protein
MLGNTARIVTGSLWTAASIVSISHLAYPRPEMLSASSLFAGMIFSAVFCLAAGATRSPYLRHLASGLQLWVPMVWCVWMENWTGAPASTSGWLAFAICACLGTAMADRGVALETAFVPPSPARPAAASHQPLSPRPFSPYESGGFARRPLAACDSGSFRMP